MVANQKRALLERTTIAARPRPGLPFSQRTREPLCRIDGRFDEHILGCLRVFGPGLARSQLEADTGVALNGYRLASLVTKESRIEAHLRRKNVHQ